MTYNEAYKKLSKYNQLHVLNYYDELNEMQREFLLEQIEQLDFGIIDNLYHDKKLTKVSAIDVLSIKDIEAQKEKYEKEGITFLKEGKVGVVILAGGMGTRLGVSYPKGMYNIGITKEKYIFECLINNIMDIVRVTETWFEVFIMTSYGNYEETVSFFEKKDYFGYNRKYINFFVQNQFFTTDFEGKIFLETKSKIAMSPNGNGGWYKSLINSNLNKKLTESNIEWLNVVSVDNVLQRIVDPCFVGATISSGNNAGAKVVRKLDNENVGVVCSVDEKPAVIEYYEIQKLDNYRELSSNLSYGVILNYLFNKKKLDSIVETSLPIHRVRKNIININSLDRDKSVNGFKYETLATDLISLMDTCLPFEVIREKEFAPIKNLLGYDSVESARKMLIKNGVKL